MVNIKLKSEVIGGKLITFTKETSLVRSGKEYGRTIPTVRGFYKGKEVAQTSYSNPKEYLIQVIRRKIKKGELK